MTEPIQPTYCRGSFPIIGPSLRPSLTCPLHQTLAVRWNLITSFQDFYDALKADSPDMESFEEWMKKPL